MIRSRYDRFGNILSNVETKTMFDLLALVQERARRLVSIEGDEPSGVFPEARRFERVDRGVDRVGFSSLSREWRLAGTKVDPSCSNQSVLRWRMKNEWIEQNVQRARSGNPKHETVRSWHVSTRFYGSSASFEAIETDVVLS